MIRFVPCGGNVRPGGQRQPRGRFFPRASWRAASGLVPALRVRFEVLKFNCFDLDSLPGTGALNSPTLRAGGPGPGAGARGPGRGPGAGARGRGPGPGAGGPGPGADPVTRAPSPVSRAPSPVTRAPSPVCWPSRRASRPPRRVDLSRCSTLIVSVTGLAQAKVKLDSPLKRHPRTTFIHDSHVGKQ